MLPTTTQTPSLFPFIAYKLRKLTRFGLVLEQVRPNSHCRDYMAFHTISVTQRTVVKSILHADPHHTMKRSRVHTYIHGPLYDYTSIKVFRVDPRFGSGLPSSSLNNVDIECRMHLQKYIHSLTHRVGTKRMMHLRGRMHRFVANCHVATLVIHQTQKTMLQIRE